VAWGRAGRYSNDATASGTIAAALSLPHATFPGGLDIASSPIVHQAIIAGVKDVVARSAGA
jgi:hypothetical protein